MRRIVSSLLLAISTVGILAVPAGADSSTPVTPLLSYDFSANDAPASVNGGAFTVSVDILSGHSGVIKVVAVAPDSSNASNQVCGWQTIQQGSVTCTFNFPVSGVWSLKSSYGTDKDNIVTTSNAALRVTN